LLLDFPRQALHAQTLGFDHPRTGKPMLFRAAPPADFIALQEALARL
jgi:23S rRNA pseudouridine1911/1915/1917 synthase